MKLLKKYWFPLLLVCAAAWLCTVVPIIGPNDPTGNTPPKTARIPETGSAVQTELLSPEGLSCQIEQTVYDNRTKSISLTLHNNSAKALGYSDYWDLQRQVGSLWHKVESAPLPPGTVEHTSFSDPDYTKYTLEEGSSCLLEYSLFYYGDWLKPGHYRAVLDVYSLPDNAKYTLAAEFDIE